MADVRVAAIADLHGNLPPMPECDLAIIAGDICPNYHGLPALDAHEQEKWLYRDFKWWLQAQPCRYAVLTWGNHDFIGAYRPATLMWPRGNELFSELSIDEESFLAKKLGLRVWLSPWSPRFYDWAFMKDEQALWDIYQQIPEGLDILVSHTPPMWCCDKNERGDHVGSRALYDRIRDMHDAAPQVLVCGHIHPARGRGMLRPEWTMNACEVRNVSAVDAAMNLRDAPWDQFTVTGR